MNQSIKDALVAEEKFFRSHPVRKYHCLVVFHTCHFYILILFVLFKVYSGLADSCGVPQLAKKLNKVESLQCENTN